MVVAAALLLSIGGLCVKMIPWQPLFINSFRSFISVGILLVFARLTRRRLRLTGGAVLGGLAVCGATALYTVATKLTTAGNAVLLQFTAPIFVILAAGRSGSGSAHRRLACLCVRRGVFAFS
ncbi:MAG: EamA family transporter, partial [Evtepia gabavorous]